jgi:precorrin-2/cobalt-factor-2 C20-methyltransferase
MTGGRLIGVGVGPGDPELLTLKALRALESANAVAHFAKAGRPSNARAVVARHLRAGIEELSFHYPVTTEQPRTCAAYREAISEFYDACARTLAKRLDAGRVVAVVCEGDPLFYGSYMHLHVRLKGRYPAEIIPGVSGMSGCWSTAGSPIAQGDDIFTVLHGTLPQAELERRLADADAAVVMKIGRHLAKVRQALVRVGKLTRAIYVERGTTAEAVTMRLADKADDEAPYFALILVPGWADTERSP